MRAIAAELVPAGLEGQLERSGSAEFVVSAGSPRQRLAVTAIGTGEQMFLEVRPTPEPAAPVAVHRASDAQRTEPMTATRSRLETIADLKALIARASSDGDAALFLRAGQAPALKLEGAVRWLDEFDPIAATDLERILEELAAEAASCRNADRKLPTPNSQLPTDSVLRWTADGALVECRVTHAPGKSPAAGDTSPVEAALTIASTKPAPADRLGLPAPLVTACRDDFGLVVVAGADARAVSRTCHSLIDAVNRDRPHHIIVLEPQAVITHQRRSAFLSHRVVTGDDEQAWMRAVEGALAEEPDVLMIDRVPSWAIFERLLDRAADALVIVKRLAPSAIEAIESLIADVPSPDRAHALARVAGALTAAAGQREIKRRGGGAAASAYELIVGTPGVRDLIKQGSFDALALALERRVDGMVSMAVAVTELMRQGRITARQARAAVPGLAAVEAVESATISTDVAVDTAIAEPVDLSDVLASLAERSA
jgi:twitching motility protein PilT